MDNSTKAMEAINLEDETDAKGFFGQSKNPSTNSVTMIAGSAEAETYSMNYPKRGKCLIFNHKEFSNGLKTRNGTDADASRLHCSFKELGFDVYTHTDFTVDEVEIELRKASEEDHTNNSCFVCCILSHGEQGVLYASDGKYATESVFTRFRGDICPTLAGKPKVFFIQACQGSRFDDGVPISCRESADSGGERVSNFKIPICADFLIVYSSVPGFYSWRSDPQGSCFIQALCEILKEHVKDMDLLSMLTIVNYRVSYDFESYTPREPNSHLKKQVPSINSTLTRMIKFL